MAYDYYDEHDYQMNEFSKRLNEVLGHVGVKVNRSPDKSDVIYLYYDENDITYPTGKMMPAGPFSAGMPEYYYGGISAELPNGRKIKLTPSVDDNLAVYILESRQTILQDGVPVTSDVTDVLRMVYSNDTLVEVETKSYTGNNYDNPDRLIRLTDKEKRKGFHYSLHRQASSIDGSTVDMERSILVDKDIKSSVTVGDPIFGTRKIEDYSKTVQVSEGPVQLLDDSYGKKIKHVNSLVLNSNGIYDPFNRQYKEQSTLTIQSSTGTDQPRPLSREDAQELEAQMISHERSQELMDVLEIKSEKVFHGIRKTFDEIKTHNSRFITRSLNPNYNELYYSTIEPGVSVTTAPSNEPPISVIGSVK